MPKHMIITAGATVGCVAVLMFVLMAEAFGLSTYRTMIGMATKVLPITVLCLLAFVVSFAIAMHQQSRG